MKSWNASSPYKMRTSLCPVVSNVLKFTLLNFASVKIG